MWEVWRWAPKEDDFLEGRAHTIGNSLREVQEPKEILDTKKE